MTCLVKSAEAARPPPPPAPRFAAWIFCATCKQHFTGLVQLRLAITLWAKYAREVETDENRIAATQVYGAALGEAGEHAETMRLERGNFEVYTRTKGPEHIRALNSACNLGRSLLQLGECAEAAVLLRTTLAVLTRTVGPDDNVTLWESTQKRR